MKKIINKISNNIYMDIRPRTQSESANANALPDELRVNTATPTATPKSIIKSDTIISQVVGTVDEETKNCFTRISMFFKKMVYCECHSSSNCVKHKK